MSASVAVLFARTDSVYKLLPGCDVFDIDRDARTWPGGVPVVAHPPCRAWGRLRAFAKPRVDEKELSHFAVGAVRTWGGVLEHPECSSLWADAGMARPGSGRDRWGGWTFPVLQKWWGHRADKATWLYVVGVEPAALPVVPYTMAEAVCTVASSRRRGQSGARYRPSLSKAEREHSPQAFAEWLVQLARGVRS